MTKRPADSLEEAERAPTQDNDGWNLVEDSRKKRRKEKKERKALQKTRPEISHAATHRLNSHVKIKDVQQLILYLLADDAAPSWVAVKNRRSIERVVVVMAGGLASDLFNGKVNLDVQTDDTLQSSKPSSSEVTDASTTDHQATKDHKNDALAAAQPAANTTPARPARKLAISPDEYYPVKLELDKLPPPLQGLAGIFHHLWPIKAPGDHKLTTVYNPVYDLLQSPFAKTAEEKEKKGPATSSATLKNWENKRTPITHYILSLSELKENGFVLHPALADTEEARTEIAAWRSQDQQTAQDGWVDTKVHSLSDADVPEAEVETDDLLEGRKVISMDCEFVKVEGGDFAVARVSLVDWGGNVLLDQLVKPGLPIVDYLTEYSGITKEKLDPATTTLAQIQEQLVNLITPRTILLGHSLESDLGALKLTHPFIVDTSVVFPHPLGPPRKSALKWLTKKYLDRDIQASSSDGHDSVEDALAVLDLVKQKCERGPIWGTSAANSEPLFKRLRREPKPDVSNGQAENPTGEISRTTAMIDWGTPARGIGAYADKSIDCQTDDDVVEGVKTLLSNESGTISDFDFIFARLRELEAVRGWWTESRTATTALDSLRESVFARYSTSDPNKDPSCPTASTLAKAVAQAVSHIMEIYDALPPQTAFIVLSGTGDTREVTRLRELQQTFNREYQTMKWDEVSVQWTDVEAQALRRSCRQARDGLGFLVVK